MSNSLKASAAPKRLAAQQPDRGPGGDPSAPRTQVEEQLYLLGAATDANGQLLASLHTRLESVLTTKGKPGGDPDAAKAPPLVPLAARLYHTRVQLEAQNQAIEALMHNIEL